MSTWTDSERRVAWALAQAGQNILVRDELYPEEPPALPEDEGEVLELMRGMLQMYLELSVRTGDEARARQFREMLAKFAAEGLPPKLVEEEW